MTARGLPSRRRATVAGMIVCLGAGLACSGSPGGGGGGGAAKGASNGGVGASAGERAEVPSERPIEMFSWWERLGDGDALGSLVKEHRRDHPGDIIINASAGLSGLARNTLRTRMERREPPDTFQANVGADLMQWVLANRADARETKLLALDDVLPAEVAEWRREMPAALLDQVSYGGKIYGVPSNVHRINSVFLNKKVLETYGLSVPGTVADLKTMAKRLKGTGVSLIAVGSKEPWTLALLAFESLMVSREGPRFYNDYLHGKLKADDPRVLQTLEEMLDLGTLLNGDHGERNWMQAADLVARGQAVMTPMGDWAAMYLNAQGMKRGKDYLEIPFPGTDQTFVFTSDAFALPVEAKNRPGAERLLRTIGSSEGQRAISTAKGVLSPRADVMPTDIEWNFVQKHTLWQKGTLVLALSGIVPPRFSEDLAVALAEMLVRRDIEPVVHTLRSRYALLK
jgi:glucose/mannose transport system substrate-binding protein